MNQKKLALCFALIGALAAGAIAQGNRGTADATIKGQKITIDYGRPPLEATPFHSYLLEEYGVWA